MPQCRDNIWMALWSFKHNSSKITFSEHCMCLILMQCTKDDLITTEKKANVQFLTKNNKNVAIYGRRKGTG